MTRKTYCGNLLWQSGLTLLAPAKGVYDDMWPTKVYSPEERYLTYQEMIKMLYKNSYYIKFEEKTVERNSDRDRVVEKLVERLLKCLNPEKE